MKDANQIAVNSNRPWVGIAEQVQGDTDFVHRHDLPPNVLELRYVWRMRNAGRRPAKIQDVNTTANWSKDCLEPPDYSRVPRELDKNLSIVYVPPQKGSHALLIPETTYGVTYSMMIPPAKWAEVVNRTTDSCLYIRIEYRDADYPAVVHHTTACRVAVPQMGLFGECSNNYASAD